MHGDALHPPFKGRLLRHREGKKGLFLIDWTATFHDQKAIHSRCIFCWLYPQINTTGYQKRNFIKIWSQKTRLKLRCVLDLNPQRKNITRMSDSKRCLQNGRVGSFFNNPGTRRRLHAQLMQMRRNAPVLNK